MMNEKTKRCTADTRGVLANTPDNRRPSSVKRRRTGRKKRSSGAKSCARIEANGLRVSFESFPSSGAILSPKSARIGFFWPFSASSWPCLATSWTTVSSCAITVCLFYETVPGMFLKNTFCLFPIIKKCFFVFFSKNQLECGCTVIWRQILSCSTWPGSACPSSLSCFPPASFTSWHPKLSVCVLFSLYHLSL